VRKQNQVEDVIETDDKAILFARQYPVPKRFLSPETSGLWVILEREPTRVDIDLKDD
jgi:hypothetical protein